MNKDTSFLKESKGIDLALHTIEFISWRTLAVTTSLTILIFSSGFIHQHVDEEQLWMTYLFVGLIGYIIVDFGITPLIAFYLRHKGRVDNSHEKNRFLKFVFYLILLKVILSLTSSLWNVNEVSEGLTPPKKKQQIQQQLAQLEANQQEQIKSLRNDWNKSVASKSKRKRETERTASKKVELVIASADKWQKISIRDLGVDGWICHSSNPDPDDKRLCKKIRAAEREAKLLLLKNDTQSEELYSSFQNKQNDSLYQKQRAALLDDLDFENNKHRSTLSRRKNYMVFGDLFLLLIGLFATYMRHIRKQAGGRINDKTIISLLGNFMEAQQHRFYDWLEKVLIRYDFQEKAKNVITKASNNLPLESSPPNVSAASPNASLRANVIPNVITNANTEEPVNTPLDIRETASIKLSATEVSNSSEATASIAETKASPLTTGNSPIAISKIIVQQEGGVPYVINSRGDGKRKTITDIKTILNAYMNKLGDDLVSEKAFLSNVDYWLEKFAELLEIYKNENFKHQHPGLTSLNDWWQERCDKAIAKRLELRTANPAYECKTSLSLIDDASLLWETHIKG